MIFRKIEVIIIKIAQMSKVMSDNFLSKINNKPFLKMKLTEE